MHVSLLVIVAFIGMPCLAQGAAGGAEADRRDTDTTIYSGHNLRGWRVILDNPNAEADDYISARDGMIHMYRDVPEGARVPFGVIMSDARYSHFRFGFEYRWAGRRFAPRANTLRDAGFLYHCHGRDKVWPDSVECQVQEGDAGDIVLLKTNALAFLHPEPDQAPEGQGTPGLLPEHGGTLELLKSGGQWGVYVGRFPEADALDGWTSVDVLVHGGAYARHTVNGQVIVRLYDMQKNDSTPLSGGEIALQLEGAEVQYRNLEMTVLDKPLRPDRYHLAFDGRRDGAGSTSIELTNQSASEVRWVSQLVGGDALAFAVGGPAVDALAPGESTTIRVYYMPQAAPTSGKSWHAAGLQIGREDQGCFLTLRGQYVESE